MNRSLMDILRAGRHTVACVSSLVIVLATLLAAGASTRVHAQCGMPKHALLATASNAANSSPLPAIVPQQQVTNSDRQEAGEGHASEPIVGLWRITVTDDSGNVIDVVISGWTSDGLEFDQDLSPILTGYVCYGTWVKLEHHTYGLTHPFFDYQDVNSNGEGSEATEGQSDGNSGYFDYKVTVDKDGDSFTGKEVVKVVQGLDPYDPTATVIFTGTYNLSATKIKVDKSLLP